MINSVKAVFFIAVLAASAALAQERATGGTASEGGRETALQGDAETAETASPAGAGAVAASARRGEREAPATPDDAPTAFDPTEEISEDYSIEFPVDI